MLAVTFSKNGTDLLIKKEKKKRMVPISSREINSTIVSFSMCTIRLFFLCNKSAQSLVFSPQATLVCTGAYLSIMFNVNFPAFDDVCKVK